MQWWRLAARQGSSQAAYNLGFLYSQEVNDDDDEEDSVGGSSSLKQDFVEALKWYREAAAAGNTGAEYNLGVMHEQGDGLATADFSAAAQWYRRAANKGDAQAQCNLGLLCFEGRGVPQCSAEAARWWRLAAAQGDEQAAENLELVGSIDHDNDDNDDDTAQGNASRVTNDTSKVDTPGKGTTATPTGEMAASEYMIDLGKDFERAPPSGSPSDVAAGADADFALSRPTPSASSPFFSSSTRIAKQPNSNHVAANSRALRLARLKANAKQKRHLLLGVDDPPPGVQEGTSALHHSYDGTLYHPTPSPVRNNNSNSDDAGAAATRAALVERARAAASLASTGWGSAGLPLNQTKASTSIAATAATGVVFFQNGNILHSRFAPIWMAVRAWWAVLRCLARAAVPALLVCISFGIAGSSLFGNYMSSTTTSSSSSSSSSHSKTNHASAEDPFTSPASASYALLLCAASLTCENAADLLLHHPHAAAGLDVRSAMDLHDAPLVARVVFLASFAVAFTAVMLCAAVSTFTEEDSNIDSNAVLPSGITPFPELDSAAALEPSAREALLDAFELLAEVSDATAPVPSTEVAKDEKRSNNNSNNISNDADSSSGHNSGSINNSSWTRRGISSDSTVSLATWTAFLSALAELHPTWASEWASEWDELQPPSGAPIASAAAAAASGAPSTPFLQRKQQIGQTRLLLPAKDAAALSFLIAADFASSGGPGRRGNGLGSASALRWRSVLGLRYTTTALLPEEDATNKVSAVLSTVGWWTYAVTAAGDLTCASINVLSWPLMALLMGPEGYSSSDDTFASAHPLTVTVSWLQAAAATVALPGGSAKILRLGHLEIPFSDASMSAAGALNGHESLSANALVRWAASRIIDTFALSVEWLASNLTVTLMLDVTYVALHCFNVWHPRRRQQRHTDSQTSLHYNHYRHNAPRYHNNSFSVGLTCVLARWTFKASAEGLAVVAAVLNSPDEWLPPRSLLLATAHAVTEGMSQDATAAVLAGAVSAAQALARAAEVCRAPGAVWDAYSASCLTVFNSAGFKPSSFLPFTRAFTFYHALEALWRVVKAAIEVGFATLALLRLYALPLAGLQWLALGPHSSVAAPASSAAEVASSLSSADATTRLMMAAAEATAAAEAMTTEASQSPLHTQTFNALWQSSTEDLIGIVLGSLPCHKALDEHWDLLSAAAAAAAGEDIRPPWLFEMMWLGRVAVSACFLSMRIVAVLFVGFGLLRAADVFGQEHYLTQQRVDADIALLMAVQKAAENSGAARAGNLKGPCDTEKRRGALSESLCLSVSLDTLRVSRMC